MQPTINIDTTNDTANITVRTPSGTYVNVHQLKLGETRHLTMDQVDAHAKALAKRALQDAIAAL